MHRLVSIGAALTALVRSRQGMANKDLAHFADQLAALCDKWEK